MSLYFLDAARSDEQRQKMVELEAAGICVFCEEHFAEHHREPAVYAGDHWLLTKNDYPYPGSRLHYLLVARKHVSRLEQLPSGAANELFQIIGWLNGKDQVASGALLLRTGDMRYNGGSIEHLHAHYLVGDVADPDHQPIRIKISSSAPTSVDAKNPPTSS